MQQQTGINVRLGRRKHLALALGMTLGLGMSAAAAVQATPSTPAHTSLIEGLPSYRQASAIEALQRAQFAANNTNTAHSTMGTIVVTNCDNDGTGSLRWAVDNASDGDTIDMSGLSCGTIKLTESIVTGVDNLTLQGKMTQKYSGTMIPGVIVDGQDSVEPFEHFGSGTLTFQEMSVQNGHHFASGGCIFSQGVVHLIDSTVKYCNVDGGSGVPVSIAAGGAIQANHATLDNSFVGGNKVTNIGARDAQGGGISTTKSLTLKNGAVISENTAEALGSGTATGGGAFVGTNLSATEAIISDNVAKSSSSALGGGIYVSDITVMKHSSVTGNHSDTRGGGLYLGAAAQVKYSTISDNNANGVGGGIRTASPITIDASTLAGNHAATTGGAISADNNVTISYSTISGNTSTHVAGGSLGGSATQPITIRQSTFSGNESTNSRWGAALYLKDDAVIRNSTITGNIEANASDTKYGAGISLQDGVSADLSSTIVGLNHLKRGDGSTDVSDIGISQGGTGATLTGDHNLITFPLIPIPADTITTDPKLGPLRNNGGITQTHLPAADSPAIDKGAANGFSTDQRGGIFHRVSGSQADIGAVERISDRIFADNFEN